MPAQQTTSRRSADCYCWYSHCSGTNLDCQTVTKPCGTLPQIDLRYDNRDQGEVNVIVAPVLRFKDVGFNADVSLEDLGSPEKLITGFAPEVEKHIAESLFL